MEVTSLKLKTFEFACRPQIGLCDVTSEIKETIAEIHGEEFAARIVACVNALAGIPTNELAGLMAEVREVVDRAGVFVKAYEILASDNRDHRVRDFGVDAGYFVRDLTALLAKLSGVTTV